MPVAVGAVVVAVALLVIVPLVAIVAGAGPFNDDAPEQTPFLTDEESITVTIRDFLYFPEDLTINAGATVTWVNEDAAPHDATDNNDAWATEVLDEGESGSITFAEAGVFPYYCSVHPFMTATVSVR